MSSTTSTMAQKRTLRSYLTNPNFPISLMALGSTLFTYTTMTMSDLDFKLFNASPSSDKETLVCAIISMVIFYTGLAATFLLLGRQRKVGWFTPIVLNGIAMIPNNIDYWTEHDGEWGFWPLVAGMWIWVAGSIWCERLPVGAAEKKKDEPEPAVVEDGVAPKWDGPTPIADSFMRDEKEVVVETVEEKDAPPTYEIFEQEEKQAVLNQKA